MRISIKDLEQLVTVLNNRTNNPVEPYTRTVDDAGKSVFKSNIGNYHLDGAYGGYKLAQIVNEGGGIKDVLYCGFTTKKELHGLIQAYISGIEVERTVSNG